MRQANKYQMFWKTPRKLSLLDIINENMDIVFYIKKKLNPTQP